MAMKMAYYAGCATALGLAANAPPDPGDFARYVNGLELECRQHLAELQALAAGGKKPN